MASAYNRGMARERDKAKWWRPRWSVRMLLIVVTLVCAYLACWEPTKRSGVEHVTDRASEGNEPQLEAGLYSSDTSAAMPFVVGIDVFVPSRFSDETPVVDDQGGLLGLPCRHYYFWFFGYVAKLPFERELPPGGRF